MSKRSSIIIGGALALASILAAASASAQVTQVVTGQTVFSGLPGGSGFARPSPNTATQLQVTGEGGAGYNNYQVSTQVSASDIKFADNATVLGSLSSVTTATSVDVTFTNKGSNSVIPTLKSQIIPGGFGLYLGDPASNPTFNNQTGIVGDANQTPEINIATCGCAGTISPLLNYADNPGNYPTPGYADDVAGASFDFRISSNGVILEDISGSLTLLHDPVNDTPELDVFLSPDAQAALPSFRLLTSPTDPYAVGYQWDASDLTLALGAALAPGASQVVSYDTTVTAFSFAGDSTVFQDGIPLVYSSDPGIVAYSGFGDPIGKGGGGTPPQTIGTGADPQGLSGPGPVQDVYFPRFQFGLPTFDPNTGTLGLPVMKLVRSLSLNSAVPEPDTWALLLAGFGGAGLLLRRRRGRQFA